jgi:hypothetical protein
MFMDQTATSNRLETLAKILITKKMPPLDDATLNNLLAPDSLPEFEPSQSKNIISAGKEIGLITYVENSKKIKKLSSNGKNAKDFLLEYLDEKVLSMTDVEPYFAKFYSYALFREIPLTNNAEANIELAQRAREDVAGFGGNNRFNETKLGKYLPWYFYLGLTQVVKKSNPITSETYPYERLKRKLNDIFKAKKRLSIDEFMGNLGDNCSELDCGEIFCSVNSDQNRIDRSLTLGVSNALIELHMNGHIILECPLDSDGWNFHSKISATSIPEELKSTKILSVSLGPEDAKS